jgi:hypothetical protein
MSDDNKKYQVGYKKPPIQSQFKPGQSGNPNGRKKGNKNLKTELQDELYEKISIREGGRLLNVSKQRALLKAMTAKALQGDTRAANVILNLIMRMVSQDNDKNWEIDLTKADQDILKKFEGKILMANDKKGSSK